jgi:hypothetical protein
MSSLVWLAITAALVAVVAVTGRAPKGGNPIARTSLMHTARYVLVGSVLGCASLGLWSAFRR